VIEAAGGPALIAGGPHEVSELTTVQMSQRPVEVTCRLDDKQAACGKKVAIIGAGPAGLSAATSCRRGYRPVIFEDLPCRRMVHVASLSTGCPATSSTVRPSSSSKKGSRSATTPASAVTSPWPTWRGRAFQATS